VRRACALVVLVLLAGCGGAAGDGEGTAQLWITRDRGETLLLEADVPAGQTVMRALAAEVEVETRYGGRFLQSVDGLEGDAEAQRDWFWFLNGYEADRSAAEVRLREGDVAWFDYRRWEAPGEARVVVGAFPEPFLHGYAGEVRPAAVRYERGREERARALAEQIGASSVEPLGVEVPGDANVLEVRDGADSLTAELRGETAGDRVRFVWSGEPEPLRRYRVG
jgi:hypothetical protein